MLGEYEPNLLPCPFCGQPPDRKGPGEYHCDTSEEVIAIACDKCDICMSAVHTAPHGSWISSVWEKGKYRPMNNLEKTELASFWIRQWIDLATRWNTRCA